MPLPHRFTQSYMLLENQQFFKITEMPRIFIPHGDKVIIIHRLHVRVFSRLKLDPAVSQHIQINTKTRSQALPSQNAGMLMLNTENQAFLFLSVIFNGKHRSERL